ncbi:Rna cytidine acetyltransferase, partial [Thalictrum thalictroides]
MSMRRLLVVDEAAAIPLPVVKSLFGPYLIFLSSTVNGYAILLSYGGTGCSLSLKLLQQLEKQSRMPNQMQNIPMDGTLSEETSPTIANHSDSEPNLEDELNDLHHVVDSLTSFPTIPLQAL